MELLLQQQSQKQAVMEGNKNSKQPRNIFPTEAFVGPAPRPLLMLQQVLKS